MLPPRSNRPWRQARINAMTRTILPPRDQIEPNTPLLLGVAAALAFPDGSMTASGFRRCGRRRLVVEGIGHGLHRASLDRDAEATPTRNWFWAE